jgi:dihydrofolate reductase
VIVSIIAAVADNGVIGLAGDLPWRLPADLRRFKQLTMGHHMVVGRKTWDSIGRRPLPGRVMIVMTRSRSFATEGAIVAHSLDDALRAAAGEGELFIAGGSGIYRLALKVADRVYLTRVHGEFEGDTVFPDFDEDAWELVAEDHRDADETHEVAYSFLTYERREASSRKR